MSALRDLISRQSTTQPQANQSGQSALGNLIKQSNPGYTPNPIKMTQPVKSATPNTKLFESPIPANQIVKNTATQPLAQPKQNVFSEVASNAQKEIVSKVGGVFSPKVPNPALTNVPKVTLPAVKPQTTPKTIQGLKIDLTPAKASSTIPQSAKTAAPQPRTDQLAPVVVKLDPNQKALTPLQLQQAKPDLNQSNQATSAKLTPQAQKQFQDTTNKVKQFIVDQLHNVGKAELTAENKVPVYGAVESGIRETINSFIANFDPKLADKLNSLSPQQQKNTINNIAKFVGQQLPYIPIAILTDGIINPIDTKTLGLVDTSSNVVTSILRKMAQAAIKEAPVFGVLAALPATKTPLERVSNIATGIVAGSFFSALFAGLTGTAGELVNKYSTKYESFFANRDLIQKVFTGQGTPDELRQFNILNGTGEAGKLVREGTSISYEIPKTGKVWDFLKAVFPDHFTPSGDIKPKYKPDSVNNLIEPGDYTPQEIRNKVFETNTETTDAGKELLKTSFTAEQQGKNVHIESTIPSNLPDVVKQEFTKQPATKEVTPRADVLRKEVRMKTEWGSDLEKKSTEDLYNRPEYYLNKYLNDYKNIINTDSARMVYEGYSGEKADELNNFALGLVKMAKNHLLETRVGYGNNTVLQTGGAPASGKSTIIRKMTDTQREQYPLIVDTTFAPNNSIDMIKKILKRGYNDHVKYFLSDPFETYKRVIDRAISPTLPDGKPNPDIGRALSIERFIHSFGEGIKNAIEAHDKLSSNPKFDITFFKNLAGPEDITETNIDFVRNYKYNVDELRKQIYEYTKQLQQQGAIGEKLYETLTSDRGKQADSAISQTSSKGKPSEKEPVNTTGSSKDTQTELYRQSEAAVIDAINSGDIEAAKALHSDFLKSDNISLPPIDELMARITDAQNRQIDEAVQEIEQMRIEGNPDDPTNTILDIAKQIRSNLLSLTGKERLAQSEIGSIQLGGKAADIWDRLVMSTDIVGFSKNIKILHLTQNDAFSKIHAIIQSGGIDGANYERFKSEIQSYKDGAKQTVTARPRKPVVSSTRSQDAQASQTGAEAPVDTQVKYDYQSTQLDLPKEEAQKVVTFANNIPDEAMRSNLKSHGFKWSPANKAWQRQLTPNARYALKELRLPRNEPKDLTHQMEYARKFNTYEDFYNALSYPGGASPEKAQMIQEIDKQYGSLENFWNEANKDKLIPKEQPGIGGFTPSEMVARNDKAIAMYGKSYGAVEKQVANVYANTPTYDEALTKLKTQMPNAFNDKYQKEAILSDLNNLYQQPRSNVATNGAPGQSVGEYARLPKVEPTTDSSVPPEHTQVEIPETNPIEFPELVKLAKELTGKVPQLGDLARMGGAVGRAYTDIRIKLARELFSMKDLDQKTKVLAHEIGHIADYLPEKMRSRGNLLGRIASLNHYMKHLLKEFPDSVDNILTPEDRKRLHEEAVKMASSPVVTQTEEVIGQEPVTVEDIKAIWNDFASGEHDPELLAYIKGLTDQQKAQLVRAAMRGKVPAWVEFKRNITQTVTKEVLQNAPEDIRRIYKDLLKEEIIKRRLFDLETIKNELWDLSKEWRPIGPMDERFNPDFIKYRKSGSELYADAISVLLNDPERLKQQAPEFWKAFFNYLDVKPEVKKTFFDTWNLLTKGEDAVLTERLKTMEEAYQKGEDLWKALREEQAKRKQNYLFEFQYDFIDRNQAWINKQKEWRKRGITIPDQLNVEHLLNSRSYLGGRIKYYLEAQINPVYQTLQKNGLNWEQLGKVMELERYIYAPERQEVANPLGFDKKTAEDTLNKLAAEIGHDKFQILVDSGDKVREAMKQYLTEAHAEGMYTPELYDQMMSNPKYATFAVLDYLDTYIPATVAHITGTLKEIANPATATTMKTLSVIRALEYQKIKNAAITQLKTNEPEGIMDARTTWDDKLKYHKPIESDEPDKWKLVTLFENGKVKGYYVDPYLASSLTYQPIDRLNIALKSLKWLQGSWFRPAFTTFNPGFIGFNFVRDLRRFAINYPNKSLLGTLYQTGKLYSQALPAAAARGFDKPNSLIQEMEQKKVLGITYNDLILGQTNEDKQIDSLMHRYDVTRGGPAIKHFYQPFINLLNFIKDVGDTIETLPKVAGYIGLKGSMPENELANFVRSYLGSPDFLKGGAARIWSNDVLFFSNAFTQGLRADVDAMAQNPRTKTGSLWKTLLLDIVPTILKWMAAVGLFGLTMKKFFGNVSEYDKTNYDIIPLGLDENGKSNYIRVPKSETQRTMSGLMWKILNIMNPDETASLGQSILDVTSYLGGQGPSFSPVITTGIAASQFLNGQNPYDFFRGRNIIPDTEFSAGGTYAAKPFAYWLFQNLGGNIVLGTSITEKYGGSDKSWLEKLVQKPIISNVLGRWVKVSNYGQTEQEKSIKNVDTQQNAVESLQKREILDKYAPLVKKAKDAVEYHNLQQQFIKDVMGEGPYNSDQKAKINRLKTELKTASIYGKVNREMDALINAGTIDVKAELLRKYKGTMSPDEYKKLITTARQNKIISDDLKKRLRKEGLY